MGIGPVLPAMTLQIWPCPSSSLWGTLRPTSVLAHLDTSWHKRFIVWKDWNWNASSRYDLILNVGSNQILGLRLQSGQDFTLVHLHIAKKEVHTTSHDRYRWFWFQYPYPTHIDPRSCVPIWGFATWFGAQCSCWIGALSPRSQCSLEC